MAVKPSKPVLIRDYYPWLQKKNLATVILSQLVLAAFIAAVLVISDCLPLNSPLLWAITAGILIVGSGSGLFIFKYTSAPLKDLLNVVVHVSGEPTLGSLPNPNSKEYAKTGFKEALQTIYDLSSSQDKPTEAGSSSPMLIGALDGITTGIVALNHDRRIIYSNKAAPVQNLHKGGASLELIFDNNDTLNNWLDHCDADSLRANRVWTRIPNKLPDNESRRLFDVIASYEKGRPAETVLTLIDRTSDYVVDEEDLNFIAFAAHELRGPITVIRGYIDVLEDELAPTLKGDQQELFRRLAVSTSRLSGYINNILNTSRYDRRHLKVHLVEDTVAQVYDMIADDMKMRATAQNRILSVHLPPDLPTIAADRSSLSEVFSNLIDNAIKYSNEGGVINVTADAKGDFVEVSVEDHGIGMPPDVVGNLFHKFYRSHRSRETVAGTGIGLYVSKAIVESHGGTISVRSTDGQGSTFTVSLPKYSVLADKLAADNNSNEGVIESGSGWIKNHSMYRG